ncbi:MAG: hypothetical protein HY695_37120 [Deltaproteobacteria bacterium]|nr:hypothetical protein [Deltaproteobacteria bacterium]
MITKAVLARGVGIIILVALSWRILACGLGDSYPGPVLDTLDWANLVFHEAGHFIFPVFGEFMQALGGSLMQLLIPVICTVHFWKRHEPAASSVTLFWTGESITHVAVYVADAQRMELALTGDIHDWNYILGKLNLLNQSEFLGQLAFFLGIATIVVALFVLAIDLIRICKRATVRNTEWT